MLLIKNGYMIDPKSGREGKLDILTEGEKILRIGKGLERPGEGCEVIDAEGLLAAVEEKRKTLEESAAALDRQIDYTALPAGIDGGKLHKMLDFTIKGLMTQRFQDASFQPEMLYEEICDYLDMVRNIVYR